MTRLSISAQEVTVCFHPTIDRRPTLRRAVARRRHKSAEPIVAVDHVTVDVRSGEALGIIGRNGAGKSTLLRLFARTLQPDSGTMEIRGKTSSLLQLGAGFNPDLSGRRNVYLGGLAAGLKKAEINEAFDEIVSYAELWDAIDRSVRTYSSGMFARLAFAVAMALDPEILLLDEIMAVGDESFRQKSRSTMQDLLERAGTVVVASHNLRQVVESCHRVMWLENGQLMMLGEPNAVVREYRKAVRSGNSTHPTGVPVDADSAAHLGGRRARFGAS